MEGKLFHRSCFKWDFYLRALSYSVVCFAFMTPFLAINFAQMQRMLQRAACGRLQTRRQAGHFHLQRPPAGLQAFEQKRAHRPNWAAHQCQEAPPLFCAAGTRRRRRPEAGHLDSAPRVVDGLGPEDAVGQAEFFPGCSAGRQEVHRGLQGSGTAGGP